MRVLVWQWGRFGAGPRIAVELARGLAAVDGVEVVLSLSRRAEIMATLPEHAASQPPAPRVNCALPVETYAGIGGFVWRMLTWPVWVRRLARQVRGLAPDLAICAMPGPLDLIMQRALALCGIPVAIVVHDAQAHPGDGYRGQLLLQRLLMRRADVVITFSRYIAGQLRARRLDRPIVVEKLPPLGLVPPPPPPGQHDGPLRLLTFGRLLPYKGLDLLAGAIRHLGPRPDLQFRVVGSGPDGPELSALASLDGVQVENRWVPEPEVAALVGWADALVLPYREASQSGVAALALAARRRVVATDVGGLAEQFAPGMAVICQPEAVAIAEGIETLVALRARRDLIAVAPTETWAALGARLITALRHELPRIAPSTELNPGADQAAMDAGA